MLEAAVYLATLALFCFVIGGTARMRQEMLLVACIPAVFVALIVGFMMALYAADAFGALPVLAALIAGGLPGWQLGRRLSPRDLLIAIYLGWAVALVLSMLAFGFPDSD